MHTCEMCLRKYACEAVVDNDGCSDTPYCWDCHEKLANMPFDQD